MVRLQVVLDSTEADLLARWAANDLRDPRDQLRWILRRELERRGLLPDNEKSADGDAPARTPGTTQQEVTK